MLEGSPVDICMGKPIAYIRNKTICPKCKGIFPIVEGVMTATFYGKGVAVAGMRTACGAVLIAGQFTDIVEWSTKPAKSPSRSETLSRNNSSPHGNKRSSGKEKYDIRDEDAEAETEYSYVLTDEFGTGVDDYRYDLHVGDRLYMRAGSYANGYTVNIFENAEVRVITWLDRDGASQV